MQFQKANTIETSKWDLWHFYHVNKIFPNCVVPENIHTPTTEGIGNSRGVGGSKSQEIPEGDGGKRRNFRPEGRKSIDWSIGASYLL